MEVSRAHEVSRSVAVQLPSQSRDAQLRFESCAYNVVLPAAEFLDVTRTHCVTVCCNDRMSWLTVLNKEVVACTRCPRLVAYREEVARVKRRAYLGWEYWGKPVSGFGDPHARVLIMGLAPGAHGSNRTGRPFTGDASGNFMYPILYETGFASQ